MYLWLQELCLGAWGHTLTYHVPGRPPPCVRGEPPLTDGEPRLSRQQWRNKQKRKKQTRNKFRTAAQTGEGGGEGAGEGGGEGAGEGGEASGGGCEEERCESLPEDGRPEKHGAAQGDRTSVPPALQCPSALPRGGQKVTAVERWRLQKLKRILQREEMKSAGGRRRPGGGRESWARGHSGVRGRHASWGSLGLSTRSYGTASPIRSLPLH
ncbi:hypothetical protein FKM82_021942 [Ascaphus truei]